MVIRTRDATRTWHTGFVVDDTDVRFGILLNGAVMPDWTTAPQIARLEGAGLIVTQILLAEGPRQVTYRILLDSIDDARSLAGVVAQTGTLTLFSGMHTEPVTNAEQEWIHGDEYEHIADVTLLLLANRQVFPISGRVELDATFQAD